MKGTVYARHNRTGVRSYHFRPTLLYLGFLCFRHIFSIFVNYKAYEESALGKLLLMEKLDQAKELTLYSISEFYTKCKRVPLSLRVYCSYFDHSLENMSLNILPG